MVPIAEAGSPQPKPETENPMMGALGLWIQDSVR